ncbi:MAG: hypothetical protein JSV12_05910 [Candidatus Bathyarchaeota archaeon]|nr:MAG: hypothetical protein JSV12_05910 [Candidatus Bathyarchaeota archaeon]
MSDKVKEIKREVAELKKKLEELRRLKADCDDAKRLREKIVRIGCD